MPDGDKPTYPKKKLIIAIGLFAVVCGFIVLGATFTNGTQPEIESFESFNSDGEAGITGPSIEQTDNGDVQLTGQITTTGEDITVKNISHSGDEVVVEIGSNGSREESSEEHTISYEAEVSGLTGSETIRVKHENGEEYTMNVEDSITYDVELLSSSSGRQERAAVKVDGNSVVINGHIAANTGGQQPVINSVEVSDKTLNVNVGTASDSDVVTQVVTSYEYKATVNNVPSSVQDVTVSHKGNTIVREQLGDESVDINSVESSSGSNEYSRITMVRRYN